MKKISNQFTETSQIEILNRIGMYMERNGYTVTYFRINKPILDENFNYTLEFNFKYEHIYMLNVLKNGINRLQIAFEEENNSFEIYDLGFNEKELLADIKDIIDREFNLDSWD